MIFTTISLTFIDWLAIAGVSFVVNLGFFVWLLLIFFRKFTALNKSIRYDSQLFSQVKAALDGSDLELAKAVCKKQKTIISKILIKGIFKIGLSMKKIENAMQNQSSIELRKLEFGLGYFVNISILAPFISFIGVVFAIFWQNYYYANFYTDTAKIWIAIATVQGVILGLIAQFIYNFFVNQLSKTSYNIDKTILWFIDYLHESH